jgi:hypothetical protein
VDNLFIGLQKRYGAVKNVRNDQQMTKRSFFATLKDAAESKNFTNKALLYPIKPHLPLLSVPHPSR